MDEQFEYDGRRPLQCFTMKMPLPLYLEFKRVVQHQKIADPADKTRYTMTAFVNGAVKKVILPGLKKLRHEEIDSIQVEGETWHRLKVTFPGHIKSHTREQIS